MTLFFNLQTADMIEMDKMDLMKLALDRNLARAIVCEGTAITP